MGECDRGATSRRRDRRSVSRPDSWCRSRGTSRSAGCRPCPYEWLQRLLQRRDVVRLDLLGEELFPDDAAEEAVIFDVVDAAFEVAVAFGEVGLEDVLDETFGVPAGG